MIPRPARARPERKTRARGARRGARLRPPPLLLPLLLGILAGSSAVANAADPALPYGINAHLPSSQIQDLIRDAGIAWIRVDFNWFMMEPQRGVYDWSATDAVVNDARARGLNVFATLAYTPGWANGGQSINVAPTDSADWYQFVFDTVSRYKDSVTHWGMWNEPDHDQFFLGSAQQYAEQILRVGARAVRDADAAGLVLGPELAALRSDHWELWLYSVLSQAGDVIDIVTHHDYDDTGDQVLHGLGVSGSPRRVQTVRGIMRLTGVADRPLWLTETGWRTDEVTQTQQADYYVQVLEGVVNSPLLDKVFFYEIADDPAFPNEWGILEADLTPKEAYTRYRDFIAAHLAPTARPLRP